MSAVIGHGGTVDAAGHDHAHDEHHGAPHGWRRWVWATNHKDIGTMYLLFSFTMFIVGGILALLIRAELFQPGLQFFNPQLYNQIVTMMLIEPMIELAPRMCSAKIAASIDGPICSVSGA